MQTETTNKADRRRALLTARVISPAALLQHPQTLPLTLLVIVVIVFWQKNSAFLSALNLSSMFSFIPELGLIALGMTMLLTAGQFDLSVGAVFGFAPLITFILANDNGVPLELAALIGLLAGTSVGLVNGILVTKFGISSFLVTLATQLIVRGTGLYISNGFPQPTLDVHSWLQTPLVGTFYVGNIQVHASLIWFVVLALLLGFVLKQTRVGNWIMATGGNSDAARARGVRTDRVTISLFVLVSALASIAGIISDLRVGSAYPDAGVGYELEVIAMAVIGGTSLFGGTGTILGTVLGVILLRSIRNGVILVGVPGLAYNIFVGGLILIAMLLQTGLRRFQTELERLIGIGPAR
jgi:simple sugar transport system permease protein